MRLRVILRGYHRDEQAQAWNWLLFRRHELPGARVHHGEGR